MVAPPDPALAAVPADARDAILAWYDATGRLLAFRTTADPYAVLVSELMAQQTQAVRAAEAWTAWTARWPTVASLAAAPVADVLRAWKGMGYNRRALNLHRGAQRIVADHAGVVPGTVAELQALPGVGPYTARAVAAIAFRIPVGAVDTNVRRVLGRLAAGGPEAFDGAAMQALADASVPRDRPDAWTHPFFLNTAHTAIEWPWPKWNSCLSQATSSLAFIVGVNTPASIASALNCCGVFPVWAFMLRKYASNDIGLSSGITAAAAKALAGDFRVDSALPRVTGPHRSGRVCG